MPLNLEQYADWLDTRDLAWPAPPDVQKPKAKPHLKRIPDVRVILWDVYGTLLAIPGGELYFVHPSEMIMNIALDKTLQEFKMWQSMSRKPGQPAEYLNLLYTQELDMKKSITSGGEKHPEVIIEKIWEGIFKKLFQKDYSFDANFYGSLNEFSQKAAYFFHASLQGTGCYPEAASTLSSLSEKGFTQGLLADAQCFTTVQLQRGLQRQSEGFRLSDVIPQELEFLSCKVGAKKPSQTLFHSTLETLRDKGFEAKQILHVGSSIEDAIAPARKSGMRTALFAGDKASLKATAEQLKDEKKRPDILITELSQIIKVVS